MRKLIVSMNITLDGYFAGTGSEMDWHIERWTREMGDALCKQLSQADTIVLGRITFTAMAGYFQAKMRDPFLRGEDFAFANMMNHYNKLVFSHTITATGWNNAVVVKGDIQVQINNLKKKQGRDIMVYGSGSLVHTLIKFNLVDEFQLWLHPVILGSGRRLFKNLHESIPVEMVGSQSFASGVVMLQYRSVGTNGTGKIKPVHKYRGTTISKIRPAKIAGIE